MTTHEKIQHLLKLKAKALVERSTADLTAIIDDNFVYVNSQGRRSSKDQYIELCTVGDLKFERQDIEKLAVTDFGQVAIGTMMVRDHFEYLGTTYEGIYRSFCVFRKVGDDWLWSGGQTTEV